MPRVSQNRQVTLPSQFCNQMGIAPGDDIQFCLMDGYLTIVKKEYGAAEGVLAGRPSREDMTDEESMQSSLS